MVECDSKSRFQFYKLGLSENAEQCCRILYEWKEAFQMNLPSFIFTDVDEAVYAVLSSVTYSDSVTH